MKPVIALDIDDVLLDTMSALFGCYNKAYGTSLTKQHNYTKDVDALGVKEYADAVARFESLLNSWLAQHFGSTIDQVRFTHFIMAANKDTPKEPLSKIDVCKEINALYMIEDHLYHAVPVAEAGIKVFLIDQPWNRTDALPAHVERVVGWKNIEKQLIGGLA